MKYIISSVGSRGLKGSIRLQGAKNSMLNNLCVPLLTEEECVISNVPGISDIKLNLDILASFGANVVWLSEDTVSIKCNSLRNSSVAPTQSVLTTGSKLFIPMMVARFGEYRTGPSRGCRIGDRQFLQYAKSLENFGIRFDVTGEEDYHFIRSDEFSSTHRLPFPSYGLTVNALLAASALDEDLLLENTCLEPEIDNTIEMIKEMGGLVERVGGTSINIRRRGRSLTGCHFRNLSDRNVAVTYAIMALTAGGDILIKNFDDAKLEAFYCFLDDIGAKYERMQGELRIAGPCRPVKPSRVSGFLYPSFHSDWQPLISVLLSQATGESYIEDRLFPSRLEHWFELGKLGAKYSLIHGPLDRFNDNLAHAVKVMGPARLHGGQVTAQNLRAGAALVTAALIAEGKTEISNAEEIERGYEDMPRILRSLGVEVDVQP